MAYLSCARDRAVKPCGAGRFAGAARALRWVVLVQASRSVALLSSGLVPSAVSGGPQLPLAANRHRDNR
ncbi:Uncharacterised protein [Mycobacteroides abscessus subsp. abscessus]|nr:Uncharacterised protein [Mycobacteroides abscessus subsp. abscessus]